MNAPITPEQLSRMNAAMSEYRAAKVKAIEAAQLVPISDAQTINVGQKRQDGSLYRFALAVPTPLIRRSLSEHQAACEQRLAAARRVLAQLNMTEPAT